MKNIKNILAIALLVIFAVSCTNEDDSIISKQSNQVGLKSEKLSTKPIAHIENGKIVLNFSQADIEKIFAEQNPDLEFILVDIVDDNTSIINSNYRLLSKYRTSEGIETTVNQDIEKKQLENGDIVYYVASSGDPQKETKCRKTDDKCTYGCSPELSGSEYRCSKCDPSGTCEQTISIVSSMSAMCHAINSYMNMSL